MTPHPDTSPSVSVLMPTFEQAGFLPVALQSLKAQTLPHWELIIVDDGSRDATPAVVEQAATDWRVHYVRLPQNRGLGAALNEGLDRAQAPLIAYLPSDDWYLPDHLEALVRAVGVSGALLAWSGVRHHGHELALGKPPGHDLQLVQVLHRRLDDRWLVRHQVETDRLDRLYWRRVRSRGPVVGTGRVTCVWRDHQRQRHKLMRESFDGGLNVFRRHYGIDEPLRFHSSDGWPVDERRRYAPFRQPLAGRPRRHSAAAAAGSMRIVIAGELAFNPERILAFEERGHQLFGLWTPDGLGDQTVGPLPFGHVRDVAGPGWVDALRHIRPHVIYALLNWRAVPFCHQVLTARLGVPLVWHFKEAPMRCVARGTWPQLAELTAGSDAQVFASEEERDWFLAALGDRLDRERVHVLDGDLPKQDWFSDDPAPRFGEADGGLHTACLGRPLGLDANLVSTLAGANIHVHLHGPVRGRGPTGRWLEWVNEARAAAPAHFHVHPHIEPGRWVRVLSRYDAGWLHNAPSSNGGDITQATWDDLNLPARIPAYMAAGIPILQRRSPGCQVAGQRLVHQQGVGLLYQDLNDLVIALHDEPRRLSARRAAWAQRHTFTFDHHVDRLLEIFREVAGR